MYDLVSAAHIAHELGVVPSAVGNWQRRNVLPPALMPAGKIDHGTPYPTAVWNRSQVPLFIEWYESRKARGYPQ